MILGSLLPDIHRVVIINLCEKAFSHTFLTTLLCFFFLKHNCCAVSV